MKRLPESYIVYRLKALVGKEMKVQITEYIFQSILLHFYDYIYIYIYIYIYLFEVKVCNNHLHIA